jgi:hypothetical protein
MRGAEGKRLKRTIPRPRLPGGAGIPTCEPVGPAAFSSYGTQAASDPSPDSFKVSRGPSVTSQGRWLKIESPLGRVTHKVRHFGRVCIQEQCRALVEVTPPMPPLACYNFQSRREWWTDRLSGNTDGACILSHHESGRPHRAIPRDPETETDAAPNPDSNRRLTSL